MMSKEEFVKRLVEDTRQKKRKKREIEIMINGYIHDEKLKNYNRALIYRRGRMCR